VRFTTGTPSRRPASSVLQARPAGIGTRTNVATGDPDPKHISISYVERLYLTMRMSMRRFTRLTNAFSKKVENHIAAVALCFMYYSFGRVHQTLRVTPPMEVGVADHVWGIPGIAGLLDRRSHCQTHGQMWRHSPAVIATGSIDNIL
jgi:hypothetical protein